MNGFGARGGPAPVGPGAVLGVDRGAFDHYGVLMSPGKVIHYTGAGSDTSGDIRIRETSADLFLRDADGFWTMAFPTGADARHALEARFDGIIQPLMPKLRGTLGAIASAGLMAARDLAVRAILNDYHVFSGAEICRRARSRLGEDRYSLAMRNCEHFAIWCATGMSTSQQVESLLYGGAELVSALIAGTAGEELRKAVDRDCREALGGAGLFRKSVLLPPEALAAGRDRPRDSQY